MVETVALFLLVVGVSHLSTAMTGKDGRPSYSKIITVLVPLLFAAGHSLPVLVAFVAIVSSHGTRLLGQWLATKPFSISGKDAEV